MLIDVFFRIFNFFVLFGLSSFLFYKYLLPKFKRALQDKQNTALKLQQEIERLKQEQEIFIQQKSDQEVLCKELCDKVDLWRSVWLERKSDLAKNDLKIKSSIKKRKAAQEHNYELKLAYEEVNPRAIDLLHKNLAIQFSTRESKKAYTEKIISFLKNTL